MAKQLRIAIVGCGRFGLTLGEMVRSDTPRACIAALVDPDSACRQRAHEVFGLELPSFESLEALLAQASDQVDAVLLTSPNHLHRDQAILAAQAAKHVFCEKPMALTRAECEAMVQAAKRNDVRLMVGHKRRLRPAWRRLQQLAHDGALGCVTAVNINGWHHHPDIPEWWLRSDEGGGLLHRAGVHDVDYLNALLGDPISVQAVAAPAIRHDAHFSETLSLSVAYESGALGCLQVSLWFAPTHFRDAFHVQAIGTAGSALLTRSSDGTQELIWGADSDTLHRETFHGNGHEACVLELNSFADWVLDDAMPVLTWREGFQCVQVMEAAYASAAADGARVPLQKPAI